jgi:hypothetical protein
MTNCDYVRHQGKKTSKDISYVLNTFRTISGSDWIKMCELTGQKIVTDVVQNTITDVSTVQMTAEELAQPTKEQLRQLRMAYYTKKTETNIIDTN